ncbi:MAG: prephenate dehydratase [Gammaproteobacteria bacterium]|nr:MAG: prephenate dehydratase [Gammaproteobacteria bacterium]
MSSDSEQELQLIRERIDALDQEIQRLVTERANHALEVARIKQQNSSDTQGFYRPEREIEILRSISERNDGPLDDDALTRIFREIMSACLALQQPITVAYLGPEGTYTQSAVEKHFGHSVRTLPLRAVDEIFREVEAGAAQFGVVAVENSTEGAVSHTLDMFLNSPLRICGDVELKIHHNLLSCAKNYASVRTIYAHQQALAQCREWLDANLMQAERVDATSNGEAARLAMKRDDCAAIAGENAAMLYSLKVLAKNIEDEPGNTTRFLIIGTQAVLPSGKDKTSLLLSAHNKPGALHRLLEPLARHGISMSRIESRPSRRGTWDYVFFIDIEGHEQDETVKQALEELHQEASLLKVLGSYPRADN